METKRYEPITGREAVEILIKNKSVYDKNMNRFFMIDGVARIYVSAEGQSHFSGGVANLTLSDVLEKEWYVKKPFDVRAEMLARPNEWVGAFKDKLGRWHKAGFSTDSMMAVETAHWSKEDVKDGIDMWKRELSKCIPIEDVPEEELA